MKFSKISSKPLVIFFHRYPPEFELIPLPGMFNVIKNLSKKYDINYFGMSWNKPFNQELRKYLGVEKIPLSVDITSAFDKWFKTFLYYLYLPFCMVKIKQQNPDIIFCRENFPFIAYLLSLLKKPVMVEMSDWWPSMVLGENKFGKKLANFIEEFDVKLWKNKNIICLTHNKTETKLLTERGINRNKIYKVACPMYGGVYSPSNAEKERKIFGFSDKDFVVVAHGIIHPSKDYNQILKWWKKLIQLHPNWKFLIIGGTIGENWCKEKIKELGIGKSVIMTGWIFDQKLLNKYLNIADCLLVTRRNTRDTQGNIPSSLTHSLMVGKPVLATGLPGILEVISDKKDGFIYKPDSYNSFKSLLEYIYNHPKKAKKISKVGLKRVKEYFNPLKLSKDYSFLIEKLLK